MFTLSKDWLLTPPSFWHLFSKYRVFQSFGKNVSVVNDFAKRVIDK